MIGDFYRNYGYPYIDTANGGTLKGALEGIDALYKMSKPDTKLIPGHGTIISREDLIPYRDMTQSPYNRFSSTAAPSTSSVVGEQIFAASWNSVLAAAVFFRSNSYSPR